MVAPRVATGSEGSGRRAHSAPWNCSCGASRRPPAPITRRSTSVVAGFARLPSRDMGAVPNGAHEDERTPMRTQKYPRNDVSRC